MRTPTSDTPLYLTRATLKHSPDVRALVQTLLPGNANERALAAHRLVWSLFAGGEEHDTERKRDFLWRELAPGQFFTLSERPPPEEHAFFDIAEPKEFAPALSPGDQLAFSLRANPVKTLNGAMMGQKNGKHVDVVMRKKHFLKQKCGDSPEARKKWPAFRTIEREALTEWLSGQGARHGFALAEADDDHPDRPLLRTGGYQTIRFRHPTGRVQYARADFDGVLTVTDPAAFLEKLAIGFGRAKSYGCGLMLIRRV